MFSIVKSHMEKPCPNDPTMRVCPSGFRFHFTRTQFRPSCHREPSAPIPSTPTRHREPGAPIPSTPTRHCERSVAILLLWGSAFTQRDRHVAALPAMTNRVRVRSLPLLHFVIPLLHSSSRAKRGNLLAPLILHKQERIPGRAQVTARKPQNQYFQYWGIIRIGRSPSWDGSNPANYKIP